MFFFHLVPSVLSKDGQEHCMRMRRIFWKSYIKLVEHRFPHTATERMMTLKDIVDTLDSVAPEFNKDWENLAKFYDGCGLFPKIITEVMQKD